MKHSRQLSIVALFAIAALGMGVSSCDDASDTRRGINESCSGDKACADGLVCGEEGKCVKADTQDPAQDKAKVGEDCGEDKACADGLECKDGKCAEHTADPDPQDPGNINTDPCKTANCVDGQSCLEGRCYDDACIEDGVLKTCEDGQMCSKGLCVSSGCETVVCDDGEVCVMGICEDALCLENSIVCNDGSTCVKGFCVDNECLGQTCDGGLACSKGDCVYPACVGKAACDPGKTCNESGECVFSSDPALNAVADTTETDENGASATVSLTLNNPPSKDVTVKCELSPESASAEAEVSCEGVLFDASNYADAQTIHVIGLPDNVIDEDQNYTLTITTVSEDEAFNGLSKSIDMVNKNVDTVGVSIIVNGSRLTTTESGGSATFSVVLNAKPTADVTFVVSTDNDKYGVIDGGGEENKLTVTFTPENWDTPQEITVKGVDDDAPNAEEHTYHVTFENTVSEDANYNNQEIKPIDAVNLDDDVAQVFLDKETVVTEEGGLPEDIHVRLGLMPADDVNVLVTLYQDDHQTDTEEVQLLTENKFTFSKDNYKDGVIISLQGIDDHIIDGDQKYAVRIQFVTFDDQYKALEDIWIEGTNVDKNEAALRKEYTETTVSESGTQLDIDISLASIPTAPVTVALSSSDKSEMIVKPASLTFAPEDWDKAQKVTVTGIDDVIIDGDIVSELRMAVTSDDQNFGGDGGEKAALSDKLEITTLDNDSAAIVVIAEGAEVMENSGKVLEFKVKLSAEPTGQVVVTAKSLDVSELEIEGQPTLIFTEETWNTAQVVYLKVKDDNEADGTQTVHIDLNSTSEDENFDGLHAQSPDYNILDNESASITLTLGKATLVPGDYNTTVSVALSALPLSDVVVTLNTTNADTAALSKTTLTFTPADWDKPQVVNLTDAKPMDAKTAKSTETISAVAAGEGQYNGLKSNNAVVTLYAFKEKSFAYTGGLQEIALLPGKYKLEVNGSQGTAGWSGGVVGKGGYSYGTYQLTSAKTLYVCVGGNAYHEATNAGGYNGGGYGHARSGGARGGGATHIAIAKRGNGTLREYASYKSEVLIVAGGAGGVEWAGTGGAGGGATGGLGTSSAALGTAGTQSAGGTSAGYPGGPSVLYNGGFGYGGYGYRSDVTTYGWEGDYGAGGGGGWYGGGGTSYAGAGSGGSGYIGGVTSGGMVTGQNASVGSAKITLLD